MEERYNNEIVELKSNLLISTTKLENSINISSSNDNDIYKYKKEIDSNKIIIKDLTDKLDVVILNNNEITIN